jgi:ribokinase
MASIVVVGSLNMDLVAVTPRIPVAGETITGNNFFSAPGGKGANQAYAAAKLGGATAMLGRVGEDDFGRAMRGNLAKVGCDVTGVRTVAGPSGVALIFVAENGANSIVIAPGANHKFAVKDIEADASVFEGCQVTLLQLEIPIEAVTASALYAKKRGARVILDPAPAPSNELPRELLSAVDILTPNESEAAMLVGLAPGPLTVDQAGEIAGKLEAKGPRTVIVKLGEQGCLLADGGTQRLIRAPKVKAVDTTAAGDVFNAALAVALSEGQSLPAACEFAVKAGAVSVTRMGAQSSAPDRSSVESQLAAENDQH